MCCVAGTSFTDGQCLEGRHTESKAKVQQGALSNSGPTAAGESA